MGQGFPPSAFIDTLVTNRRIQVRVQTERPETRLCKSESEGFEGKKGKLGVSTQLGETW